MWPRISSEFSSNEKFFPSRPDLPWGPRRVSNSSTERSENFSEHSLTQDFILSECSSKLNDSPSKPFGPRGPRKSVARESNSFSSLLSTCFKMRASSTSFFIHYFFLKNSMSASSTAFLTGSVLGFVGAGVDPLEICASMISSIRSAGE